MQTPAKVLMAAFLAAGFTNAGATAVRGPVMGYVLDGRSGTIRPVNGIPGAAHLGAPLSLGIRLTRAVFSSSGDFALAADGAGAVLVIRGLDGAASATPLAGTIPAERIVLNAAGTGALLYASEPARLQVVRGLPENPAAGPVVELTGMAGAMTALSLDAAGRHALLAFSGDGRGSLVRLTLPDMGSAGETRDVESRVLGVFAAPSALALLPNDRDALVADALTSRLFLVRDLGGGAEVELVASAQDGLDRPVGVEVDAAGRRAFVANGAGAGGVAVLDLQTRAVEWRPTPEGTPSRLERLQGRTTFVLNELGEAPLLILDSLDLPEVYFVPAGREN